jgi:hypothetical protein
VWGSPQKAETAGPGGPAASVSNWPGESQPLKPAGPGRTSCLNQYLAKRLRQFAVHAPEDRLGGKALRHDQALRCAAFEARNTHRPQRLFATQETALPPSCDKPSLTCRQPRLNLVSGIWYLSRHLTITVDANVAMTVASKSMCIQRVTGKDQNRKNRERSWQDTPQL